MHIRVARTFLPLLFLLPASVLVAQKQPFDVRALMQLARISDPQLSPDGRLVAFTVQTVDLEKNTKPKQIYVVPLAGGGPRTIAEDAEQAALVAGFKEDRFRLQSRRCLTDLVNGR